MTPSKGTYSIHDVDARHSGSASEAEIGGPSKAESDARSSPGFQAVQHNNFARFNYPYCSEYEFEETEQIGSDTQAQADGEYVVVVNADKSVSSK